MAAPTPSEIRYYEEHASDTRQPQLIASLVCGLIIAYSAVSLRILARRQSKAGLGTDDILILAALLPVTAYAIGSCLAIHAGEGKHIIFVTNARLFIESYVTAIVSYSISVVLIKISILCLYCRIFPSRGLRNISWSMAVVVIAYNIALILVTALECVPLSALWTMKPATCINTRPPFLTLAIVNTVTDVAILTLPLRFIWSLQIRTTRKIQLCGIFLLGSVVCVFGLLRTVAIGTTTSKDPSYNQAYSGIWSYAEITVGVVAACLPTFGVLFTKTRLASVMTSARKLLSTSRNQSNDSGVSKGQNGSYESLSKWIPDRWGKSSFNATHITRNGNEETPPVPSLELEDYNEEDNGQLNPVKPNGIHLRTEFGTKYTNA